PRAARGENARDDHRPAAAARASRGRAPARLLDRRDRERGGNPLRRRRDLRSHRSRPRRGQRRRPREQGDAGTHAGARRARPDGGARDLAADRLRRPRPVAGACIGGRMTRTPRELVRELVEAYNEKSLERLVELYRPEARYWDP